MKDEPVEAEITHPEENPPEPIENPLKKKKKWYSVLGDTVLFTVLGFLVLTMGWNLVDRVSGYNAPVFGTRSLVVLSDSMSVVHASNRDELKDCHDQFNRNDIVFTVTNVSFKDLQIYDVVTYKTGSTVVVHRLIGKDIVDGKKIMITRGDANDTIDGSIDYDQAFMGKVVKVIPKLGVVVGFLQSPYAIIGFCGATFFVVLGILIADGRKSKKQETPKQL